MHFSWQLKFKTVYSQVIISRHPIYSLEYWNNGWDSLCYSFVHYSSEQCLEKVSSKVSSFCQQSFKSILHSLWDTCFTMPPPRLPSPGSWRHTQRSIIMSHSRLNRVQSNVTQSTAFVAGRSDEPFANNYFGHFVIINITNISPGDLYLTVKISK